MITVPGFLLRRLYVKGSLRNTREGFEFQLRNQLGSGYARSLDPVSVDGVTAPIERCSFSVDGKETAFGGVSKEAPFALAMNRSSTILVRGEPLSPGPHKIGLGFEVAGLGKLSFDFTDVVADG